MAKIINVSNRLPIAIRDGKIKKPSGGLVAALDSLSSDQQTLTRIGWTGGPVEDPARRREIETLLRKDFNSTPIFLTEEEAQGYYEGFSNSSLWPLLHYMPSKMWYEPGWWEQYRTVNRKFADAILDTASEGDLVWVHDYHLMLVPQMVKEAKPSLKVGFFLHTPFPSYEVFRCHPRRRELLLGLLGADQIGFHTFGYLRHFRSTVLRLLGIESDITRIRQDGHTCNMGIYPIGINASNLSAVLDSDEYRTKLAELRTAHEGKRVVLSVERLDYTKGIIRRLEAIDLFLARYTEREKILFIFISVPSREEVEEYKDLREEVEARVGRLNGKYATVHHSPIHFIHGTVDLPNLCALYSLAEVAMVTPLIDGMNLVAKEYVACQRENPGVLILSEFAGAAEELSDAITVNPYDLGGVADALGEALRLTPEERSARMKPMTARVMKYDAAWWARTFVSDLASHLAITPWLKSDPLRLDEARQRLASAIHDGKRVGLFLDYDGTLREIQKLPADARPDAAVEKIFELLSHAPDVDVTLISGRRAVEMQEWFGRYPFSLIAEHGAEIRRAGRRDWDQLDRNVNYDWKEQILRVLRVYEASTPGSVIEEKRSGLVWHYRRTDPEFGEWKANQLADELGAILANEPVQIRHGKKIIEVAATLVNKGRAVGQLLEENGYALALAAGDDLTDESMFQLAAENLLTLKVGPGDTAAHLRVPSPAAFRRFLQDLLVEPAAVASSGG